MPAKIDQYSASDGAILKYRMWAADSQSDALVYLHGIESHSEWFSECAEMICGSGMSVYALDRRGSGLNASDRGHCRSYRTLISDVADFGSAARKRHERLHLCGLSWGGKLAVGVDMLSPSLFSSLTLIGPGLFPRVSPSPLEKAAIAFDALFRPRALHSIPIRDEMFTSLPKYLEYIGNDSLRLRQVTARFYLESTKMDVLLRRRQYQWSAPTQLLLAEHDVIIDNKKMQRVYDLLNIERKRIRLYAGCNHSLQFEKPADVARDIIEWAKK